MDLKFVTDKDGKKEGIKPKTQVSILRGRRYCHIEKTRNSGLEERVGRHILADGQKNA